MHSLWDTDCKPMIKAPGAVNDMNPSSSRTMPDSQGRSWRGRRNERGRWANNNRGRGTNNTHGRWNDHTSKPRDHLPPSENYQAFNVWRKDIPFFRQGGPSHYSSLSHKKLEAFMQTAQHLVDLRDNSIRQEVISSLASEGGLMRIAELVGTDLATVGRKETFEKLVLPFFRTMTHHDVLSSLLLEKPVGDIYVFIYGIGGRRASALFASYKDILRELLNHHPGPSIHLHASTMLSGLLKVLECNQSASLITEFHAVVDVLQACLDHEPETFKGTLHQQAAAKDMLTVRRYLKYGDDISPLKAAAMGNKKAAFAFELSQDGPGSLSAIGRRHDNDHESIEDIKILPTAQEIRSQRSEYLPSKESASWHIPGIHGLLDQQFRLLREDTVGQLRDCVRIIMEELTFRQPGVKTGMAPDSGLSNFRYSQVSLSDVYFEERQKQLVVVATFAQPQHLQNTTERARATWWEDCKHLKVDSLVCLLDSEGNALFFSVYARGGFRAGGHQTTHPGQVAEQEEAQQIVPSVWAHPRNAVVTLRIIDMDNPALIGLLGRDWKSKHVEQVLVEFPGVLLPSFQPTLEALQHMSRHSTVPFSDIILPESEALTKQTSWPAYATQPGFAFDLGPITRDGSHLYLSRNNDFDHGDLKSRTTLDDAQCIALIGALSRNLALMQGPPGTGKSFVAIQAVKVLLECRLRANLQPIICVCYTNHALDQFLEQMLEDGVKQVVRIGGQSKSSRLESVNLREITQKMEATKTEKHDSWQLRTQLEQQGNEIENLYRQMRRASQPFSVMNYIKEHHLQHYSQIVGEANEEGFETVRSKRADAVKRWLDARPMAGQSFQIGNQDRPVARLHTAKLNQMSKGERRKLHQHWISDMHGTLSRQLNEAIRHFVDIESELTKNKQEIKLRCLEEAHIIGITTSGLAKNVDLLRRLRPKVLICEEAGEILEAHTLTAFLPSIEHAILIGDHEQLRPQVQNYSLSVENARGEKHSLDMSTFERLISTLEIPHDTLQTQRRMDPSISDLIRQTIYPTLMDHGSVLDYPSVSGVRKRLFWLDHQVPEVRSDPSKVLNSSHSNDHEIGLVEALVMHLVRQGVYGADDIVVLTPYVRQLQKLRQRLASSFEIVIGEKDNDELAKQDTGGLIAVDSYATHRAMLTQRLRISTVDNFQGEEAKVVVISLVRSNPERKCGFLRTTNRINVLLSRAKHGMYIIGNSQTYSHVPMWSKVIDLLHANGNMGSGIPLCCPQHPDTLFEVATPEDFHIRAPEGGCDLQCNLRLDCGHACSFKCHSTQRHEAVICQEPCSHRHPSCGHICPKHCGIPCGVCHVVIKNVILPCEHMIGGLECFKTEELASVPCKQLVQEHVPGCGHTVMVPCGTNVRDPSFNCKATCGALLPCGHMCRKLCNTCRKHTDKDDIDHGICDSRCGRDFSTCSHSCQKKCHGKEPCPLCDRRCSIRCGHSQCAKRCHEPCAPCAEKCDAGCSHQGSCKMPCAVPCNIVPCSRRCDKLLTCGHQCPSVCGESCPADKYCQICAPETIKTANVDYIMGEAYKDVDLDTDPIIVPHCGHLTVLSSMDGIMDMEKHYKMSPEGKAIAIKLESDPFSEEKIKVCPQCRGSLRQINRYSRVVKRAMLDESTKRLIVWSNAQFVPLTARLQREEQRLSSSDVILYGNQPDAHLPSPAEVRIQGPRNGQITSIRKLLGLNDRLGPLFVLREEIRTFLSKVREDEQPFSRVHKMLQSSQQIEQQSADEHFRFDSGVLQTRHRLLTESLLYRCDYAILSDFLNIYQKSGHRKHAFTWLGRLIGMDLTYNRRDCLNLARDALDRGKSQPMVAVEAHVQFAKFVALERMLPLDAGPDGSKTKDLVAEGRKQLETARRTVMEYPSIATMNGEIDGVEKMLCDSTFYTLVTSAEQQAVYEAMAQDFRGTGHWYYCVNRHPFTVGECGLPMQTSRCPQCGAAVGGQSHQAVAGVTHATDFEQQFGQMQL